MFRKTGLIAILISLAAIALISILSQTVKRGPAKTTRPDSASQLIKQKEASGHPYQLTKKTYATRNVKINYPQITGLKDLEQQNAINALIRDEALKVRNYYAGADQPFTLEIDYQLKLVRENLLSIQYTGVGYAEGAAYPNNLIFTTNIDLRNGSKLRLKDLVNINESLVKTLQSEKLKSLKPEHHEILKGFTDEELLDKLNRADSFSYLTIDSLGISLSVPHAIGDHAEFEIKYSAILNHFKIKDRI